MYGYIQKIEHTEVHESSNNSKESVDNSPEFCVNRFNQILSDDRLRLRTREHNNSLSVLWHHHYATGGWQKKHDIQWPHFVSLPTVHTNTRTLSYHCSWRRDYVQIDTYVYISNRTVPLVQMLFFWLRQMMV